MTHGLNMSNLHISLMEQNDIQQCAKVLSIAMLNNPHHIGVFLGNGEKERLEIENMFFELLNILPGLSFWQRKRKNHRSHENEVMRWQS
jgi:hypothetical protein